MTEINNIENTPEIKNEQEKGAGLVEYALLVALIAIVAIAALQFLGTSISEQFSNVGSTIDN